MSTDILDRLVFLNVVQNDTTVHVSFYIAGGRVDGTIYLTDHGYWQARLDRYQPLDDDNGCFLHSTVEHVTDKQREPVATWIAHQIDTALQTPRLTPAERRMVAHLNDTLRSMFLRPGTWGGPEAHELQALQVMELREVILHPNNDVREILDRYAVFLRGQFPKNGNEPAYRLLAKLHPGTAEEYALTCHVAAVMEQFNQELIARS